jgi:hypothetical protein
MTFVVRKFHNTFATILYLPTYIFVYLFLLFHIIGILLFEMARPPVIRPVHMMNINAPLVTPKFASRSNAYREVDLN